MAKLAKTQPLAPAEALSRCLSNYGAVDARDRAALEDLVSASVRMARPHSDIVRESEAPPGALLIVSGWGCRYKMLEDGRRQIIALLLPGDFCDLHNTVLSRMDHSIGAIDAVRYVVLSSNRLAAFARDFPRLGDALLWQTAVAAAIQREWTLNTARRNASERVGSLLCEILMRARAVGLADGDAFHMPLTQIDIAEATGLTPVHVNRTIQAMRGAGLIDWAHKTLALLDFARLQVASCFTPEYLHLTRMSDGDDVTSR